MTAARQTATRDTAQVMRVETVDFVGDGHLQQAQHCDRRANCAEREDDDESN